MIEQDFFSPTPQNIRTGSINNKIRTETTSKYINNMWNSLPQDVVAASGIDGFKKEVRNFTEAIFMLFNLIG